MIKKQMCKMNIAVVSPSNRILEHTSNYLPQKAAPTKEENFDVFISVSQVIQIN